ncbi:MAG TPA: hypothetical protein ENI27_04340 [bacterium]|nr:hypothetical protein [bacterium]
MDEQLVFDFWFELFWFTGKWILTPLATLALLRECWLLFNEGDRMSSYMRTLRRRIVRETPGRAFIRNGGDYHPNGLRRKPEKSKHSKFRGAKQ